MRSVIRSLQQSAKAALGRNAPAPVDPLAEEEAQAAEQARIAATLAHVGEIAYVEPPPAVILTPSEAETVAESPPEPSEEDVFAALTAVLDAAMQRSQSVTLPPELRNDVAMPEGWQRVPLVSWLEERGERAFKHLSGHAMLYRYFNVWEDGERQEMWSVYVTSADKPDSRCISFAAGPAHGRTLPSARVHAEKSADCLAFVKRSFGVRITRFEPLPQPGKQKSWI